jgi:hypothetical protein
MSAYPILAQTRRNPPARLPSRRTAYCIHNTGPSSKFGMSMLPDPEVWAQQVQAIAESPSRKGGPIWHFGG